MIQEMDTFQKALDDTSGGAITAQKERERRAREQQRRQRQTQNEVRANVTGSSSSTLEQSLEPVLKAEKSDLMFWMMVLQVLLLVGIWRNTKSEG